jgi:hypothetical protein
VKTGIHPGNSARQTLEFDRTGGMSGYASLTRPTGLDVAVAELLAGFGSNVVLVTVALLVKSRNHLRSLFSELKRPPTLLLRPIFAL